MGCYFGDFVYGVVDGVVMIFVIVVGVVGVNMVVIVVVVFGVVNLVVDGFLMVVSNYFGMCVDVEF